MQAFGGRPGFNTFLVTRVLQYVDNRTEKHVFAVYILGKLYECVGSLINDTFWRLSSPGADPNFNFGNLVG